MIVYVETNFVLEIAREQEQVEAANRILVLAEQRKIELAFPSFTLSEPFSTIIRQRKDRKELLRSLQDTLVQLRRSETHIDLSPQDSIIYSAIISDIMRRPVDEDKRFLSRDNEAFATNLAIKRELRKHNCRYIGSFVDGLASIEHAL